jgi:hypothetical protein
MMPFQPLSPDDASQLFLRAKGSYRPILLKNQDGANGFTGAEA